MTNASTPFEARKADLSSTDMPSRVESAMNLHASGTPTAPSTAAATGSSGWPCTLSSLVTQVACAMTNASTPFEARKADLSSSDMPSRVGSAMNVHASGTLTPSDAPSATGSSAWPCTLSSGATHEACAMTNALTPFEARYAAFTSTDTPSRAGLAMNLQALGTLI
eukprot:scaffold43634_cov64-Phaeocystis_antarctica.AAC.13